MSKEAMKLALEALENSVDLVREDAYQAEKLYGNYPARQGKVNGLKVLADDHEKAITALQKALANEALDKMAENARELGLDYEPAQKPQRWAVFCQGCGKEWSVSYPHPGKDICVDCDDKLAQQDSTCSNTLRAQGKAYPRTCKKCGLGPCIADRVQPAQQEYERGFIDGMQEQMKRSVDKAVNAMAQRTWVGLTDEDMHDPKTQNFDFIHGARWAEAKLKEKNT